MTQQSHSQAYTLRKPKLKKTHVLHCSLQHYLEQLEHGSNLDVHQQMNGKRSCGTYTQCNMPLCTTTSLSDLVFLKNCISNKVISKFQKERWKRGRKEGRKRLTAQHKMLFPKQGLVFILCFMVQLIIEWKYVLFIKL